jgi:hypothetical protein
MEFVYRSEFIIHFEFKTAGKVHKICNSEQNLRLFNIVSIEITYLSPAEFGN